METFSTRSIAQTALGRLRPASRPRDLKVRTRMHTARDGVRADMVAGRGGTDRMHDGRAGNDVWAVIHTAIPTANHPACIIKPTVTPRPPAGPKKPDRLFVRQGDTPELFLGLNAAGPRRRCRPCTRY